MKIMMDIPIQIENIIQYINECNSEWELKCIEEQCIAKLDEITAAKKQREELVKFWEERM